MKNIQKKLVCVYVNEGDKWRDRPMYLEILKLLKREGLSGGTVLRAIAGFTAGGGVHTISLVDATGKLPLVVQFVDTEEKIGHVLLKIREMVPERLITIEDVEVLPLENEPASGSTWSD